MVTKELLDYIKKQISKGVGQDDVRKILIQYKWAENDINEAFNVINQANQPKTEKPKIEVKPLDEFRNQQVRGGVQAQTQTQPQPQIKPVVQQPVAQAQTSVQQPANQKPAQTQPQIQKPIVQQSAQQPIQQPLQGAQPQAQPKVQVVQPQTQPQSQAKPVVQQPVTQTSTAYREPLSQPQAQVKPQMQQPIVEHKLASSSFNIWPIIIGLIVFGLVIFGGIYGYNALVKNKPNVKAPSVVKPEEPIVATTTKTEKNEEPVQKPKIEVPAQPSSDESLVKELDAVIAYLKNKSAYSVDQRNDLEKSNVLVNLGFFLQLYQSKNTKYPEMLDDIMSLGKYKMLNDFSKAIFQFAYGKTPAGEFRICAQYSNGYRCFVSDDEFRAKAKTYIKNLK